jgi:hypothetical protein
MLDRMEDLDNDDYRDFLIRNKIGDKANNINYISDDDDYNTHDGKGKQNHRKLSSHNKISINNFNQYQNCLKKSVFQMKSECNDGIVFIIKITKVILLTIDK